MSDESIKGVDKEGAVQLYANLAKSARNRGENLESCILQLCSVIVQHKICLEDLTTRLEKATETPEPDLGALYGTNVRLP